MKTDSGRPYYVLDPPDDPYSTSPTVHVFPSASGPKVALILATSASPYWPIRDLTPEQAREVARALTEAAEIVEAGTFRPWEDPSQRAGKP